ncbi:MULTISPECIES: PucR family transcriptional regulator [unclassified Streptomyces]|uniref:PucR family transcriptional regulator n=1 Tax=unclassified Streptomyces TaxID=2593676 RepID=UPI002E13D321|nr:helix-turn-helix domain-containing protein [Streptomyces sp. NBC_01207]WTA17300.1 helix-turn-helix domain-containing protein [Streptomyces sp. NBC_00853]
MCELLNRIWSRPRGEWTRVLRMELPALAAEIVEELLHGIPEFSALIDDNDAIDDELFRQRVEEALLTVLGYQDQHREPAPEEHDEQSEDEIENQSEVESQFDSKVEHGIEHRIEVGTAARAECEVTHEGRREGLREVRNEVRNEGRREGLREVRNEGLREARHTSRRESRHEGVRGMDRARHDLFKTLTDDRDASDMSLSELAEAAGWPLPLAVRAIVPATPGETQQLAAVLDHSLVGMFAGRPCLLVPSAEPDNRAPLENLLRGRFAAVGHAVPLRDTASSLRWALRLAALTPARPGLEVRPVFVDDHLSTLLLLQDEPLAHALAARWLRPLADLTPRQSERLEVTLLAWLEGGGAPEAAKALSVHPQTVRYRMRQLEKLFGTGLRDPRTRFELEMALRSRRLMAQVRRQHSRVGRRAARVIQADFTPMVVGRMARVNGL